MSEQKTINLDHTNGTIYTNKDDVIKIGVHGALRVGDGTNIVSNDQSMAGCIRFKKGSTFSEASYELHNGTQWQRLVPLYDPSSSIIFSIIFG